MSTLDGIDGAVSTSILAQKRLTPKTGKRQGMSVPRDDVSLAGFVLRRERPTWLRICGGHVPYPSGLPRISPLVRLAWLYPEARHGQLHGTPIPWPRQRGHATQPEDATATSLSEETFNYIHEVIGFTSASDVQTALEAHATAAGVRI